MMEQTLIDTIVKEVLRRLSLKSKKRVLALFSSYPDDWDLAEKQIESFESDNYDVKKMMTPEAQQLKDKRHYLIDNDYSMDDYLNVDCILEKTDVLILPTLSINSVSKIACGYYDNLVTKFIIHALYQNKKVIASNGFIRSLNDVKNDYIKDKLMEYVFEIQKMGIVFVKPEDIKKTVLKPSEKGNLPSDDRGVASSTTKGCVHYEGKILDASTLMALEALKISYNQGTLITALAEDYAKEKEIQLIKNDN